MKLFCVCLSLSFVVSCIHRLPSPFLEESQSVINKQIRDITFWPLNGLSFRLSELKERKAFVIVMREKDCPISEKYGGRLKAMEEEYSKKGIQFIYVYVGQVRVHEMARADLKSFGFKSFYVVDLKQRIINILSAQTTGDVFVLNSDRRVIYKGPLDDQYHVLKKALKAKNHYVREVLDNLLSGEEIKPRELPAPGCIISRPVLPSAVYWKDVAPIVRNKCTSCHNPKGIGPMNFVRYEDVAGRGRMFEHVIRNDLMPPWYLADNLEVEYDNDLSLGVKEKALLLKWAKTGFKKGKAFQNRILWKERKRNWKADYVISLPEKVVIPEEGFLYHYFVIDPKFKEDKWIKFIDFDMKPKIIHHARVLVLKPGFQFKQKFSFFEVKGNAQAVITQNNSLLSNAGFDSERRVDVKIPFQSKLLVEIHYEAQGKKIIDDSTHINMKFYKKSPESQYVELVHFKNPEQICILPQESHFYIKKTVKLKNKMDFLQYLSPHMHFRGKRTSAFIVDTKGNRRRIFGLDPWLASFETSYRLKEAISIPKGSVLEYNWWFDNSEDNIFNPDPNQRVLGGLSRTENEMAEYYLFVRIPSSLNFESYSDSFSSQTETRKIKDIERAVQNCVR
ncbi:MAG: redoxin family protein [Oligoflexia bacterium]|nr:redoxin family protein [Oligoflexia bacterium]